MLIERQVSVFFAATGAALLTPAYSALLHRPDYVPGPALAVGTVLGALGVFFGSAVAVSHTAKAAERLFLSCWSLAALVLAAGALLGIARHPGPAWSVTFAVCACLPLAAALPFWLPPRGG